MTSLDKRREIIRHGNVARELLENETLLYAFEAVGQDALATFISTAADEGSERDAAWATYQALGCIKNKLEAFVDDGKVEERNKAYDEQQRTNNNGE